VSVATPGCGYGGRREVLPAGVVAPFSGTARDSGGPTWMMMAIQMASGTPWPARWGPKQPMRGSFRTYGPANLASARLKRPECEATRSWPVAD
jgi:hypothetical protein